VFKVFSAPTGTITYELSSDAYDTTQLLAAVNAVAMADILAGLQADPPMAGLVKVAAGVPADENSWAVAHEMAAAFIVSLKAPSGAPLQLNFSDGPLLLLSAASLRNLSDANTTLPPAEAAPSDLWM